MATRKKHDDADDLLGSGGSSEDIGEGASNLGDLGDMSNGGAAEIHCIQLKDEAELEAWRDFALAGRGIIESGEIPARAATRLAEFADYMLRAMRRRARAAEGEDRG